TRSQSGHVFGGPLGNRSTQFFESFEEVTVESSVEQHFATPSLSERRFLGLPRFARLRPFLDAPASFFFSTNLGAPPLRMHPLPGTREGLTAPVPSATPTSPTDVRRFSPERSYLSLGRQTPWRDDITFPMPAGSCRRSTGQSTRPLRRTPGPRICP